MREEESKAGCRHCGLCNLWMVHGGEGNRRMWRFMGMKTEENCHRFLQSEVKFDLMLVVFLY